MSRKIQPARLNQPTQSADQQTSYRLYLGPNYTFLVPKCIFWAKTKFFGAVTKFYWYYYDWTAPERQLVCVDSVARRAHLKQFRTIFGPKICITLRPLQHPIFGLWWILLNVIITSLRTEVNLDTFGFLVGAHSTAWRAIMRPPMAKMALFGAKNAVFWPKILFFGNCPIFLSLS